MCPKRNINQNLFAPNWIECSCKPNECFGKACGTAIYHIISLCINSKQFYFQIPEGVFNCISPFCLIFLIELRIIFKEKKSIPSTEQRHNCKCFLSHAVALLFTLTKLAPYSLHFDLPPPPHGLYFTLTVHCFFKHLCLSWIFLIKVRKKKRIEKKQFHQQPARKLKAVIFASVGVNERV